MATGHRPQLRPQLAKRAGGFDTGGLGSASVSTRSLPSYLTLKTRKPGQGGEDDMQWRNMKAELEDREREHFMRKEKEKVAADPLAVKSSLKLLTAGEVESEEKQRQERLAKYEDSDADAGSDGEESEGSSEDDDDDDDEEEEAEMMRELEKIKKEREEERQRKEAEESEAAALEKREAAMKSNPVLNLGGERAAVKRRWDDDVVFRNQAKDEPAAKKRFVNDPLRSDFHRKFLRRYIK